MTAFSHLVKSAPVMLAPVLDNYKRTQFKALLLSSKDEIKLMCARN